MIATLRILAISYLTIKESKITTSRLGESTGIGLTPARTNGPLIEAFQWRPYGAVIDGISGGVIGTILTRSLNVP